MVKDGKMLAASFSPGAAVATPGTHVAKAQREPRDEPCQHNLSRLREQVEDLLMLV